MTEEFDFILTRIDPGLSVIEAGAGTGKTYAISHLVPRLLLEGLADNLGRILLVTYTNDAAGEMADRVRRVLEKLHAAPGSDEAASDPGLHKLRQAFPEEKIRAVIGKALLDLDRLGVSTIHSFCLQTLQTEGALCGEPVLPELITDSAEYAERALRDIWELEVAADPLLAALAQAGGWNLDDDLAFVQAALSIPGLEFDPPPRPFAEVLTEIRSAPQGFTAEGCGEVGALWKKVVKWNQGDWVLEDREGLLQRLATAPVPEAPGFFDAVRQMANCPNRIEARSKEAKAIKMAAGECDAVGLAQKLCALLDRSGWYFRIDCLERVRNLVASGLRANRQITYDGLVERLHAALTAGPQAANLAAALRARYQVALIDESQDTDLRQLEIFRRVFLDPEDLQRMVLIGDPKQAIYAFRGADVNTYLQARAEAGNKVFSLTKTYRAPDRLVRAANAFFSRAGSFLKEGLEFIPATSGISGDVALCVDGKSGGPRVETWIAPDADADFFTSGSRRERIAAAVASEIVGLLNARATLISQKSSPGGDLVRPRDFAVLVRAYPEAVAMTEALRLRAVPAIRAGGDDIMASEEATEILALLRALESPRRNGLVPAALATRLMGRDFQALVRSRAEEEDAEKFVLWQALWQKQGVSAVLGAVDRDERITLRLALMENGERRITNFRQLTDLLQHATVEVGPHPADLVRWLSGEVKRAGKRTGAEDRQLHLESDADAVQVLTMHSAKGLEYPLVFCPFLWAPSPPGNTMKKLAIPGRPPLFVETKLTADETVPAALQRAEIEDRLRLAYVAVTRAKAKVWLVAGETSGKGKVPPSAMDWLLRDDAASDFCQWIAKAAAPGRGERHGQGIRDLVAAGQAEGLIGGKAVPPSSPEKWVPPARETPAELDPLAPPAIPEAWAMTSFSALTREKHPHAPEESPPAPSEASGGANPFLTAPGGTEVGTAIHDWIEQWDFDEVDRLALETHLGKYSLPRPPVPPTMCARVAPMLETLRSAILPGLDCSIAEACPRRGASEWHFQLPIGTSLSASALAEVFARHGHQEYAGLLAALPSEKLHGYLHGFLDRLAFRDGTWGVIDWKTNQLGQSAAAYRQASLLECAWRSHYFLQAHLYLVALRRFLNPEVPVAGAWLVFLRGVAAGSSDGILQIAPTPELLADLDHLFAHPES
ncbi:MAG: UvrD-helicase domain-containing protein [Verrucomicrobiae bacterium]